jgi:DNA-binding XRE family transcriptional regulator
VSTKPGRTKKPKVALSSEKIARDDGIEAQYADNPSLRQLYERGDIDKEAYEQSCRLRAAGPPERPFRALLSALRAERERQGLSLSALANRSGIDRAALHKLEIGLNKNPTAATLSRYAEALGKQIEWTISDRA